MWFVIHIKMLFSVCCFFSYPQRSSELQNNNNKDNIYNEDNDIRDENHIKVKYDNNLNMNNNINNSNRNRYEFYNTTKNEQDEEKGKRDW